MKLILTVCYWLSILPLFSQNKVSDQELKTHEWIVYNRSVDDSSEIFNADTLLLAKSYKLGSFEQVTDEDNQQIDQRYPRFWRLDFALNDLDTSVRIHEFYVFFIDLRRAAMHRSIEVDSVAYQLLRDNPHAVPVSEIEKMQPGDIIQIADSIHNQFFYIEKTGNKLHVLKTLKRRYILNPQGLNDGFWTFSKRKQLITFSNNSGGIQFTFRVERIDHVRIRLIRTEN